MARHRSHPRVVGSFAAVLLLATAMAPARAEVAESLDYIDYRADPRRGQGLREALDAATPVRPNGKIFHGNTQWHIRWSLRWWREANGRCRITSNTTTLDLDITLPQLGSGSSDLRQRFQRYRTALHAHELGHARIARAAAAEIDRAILDLPEMASCTALEAAANRVAYALLADATRAQNAYDRATEHGRLEGARVD